MTGFKEWMLFAESGYAKVRRILFGDVPTIRAVGIVTAQNPYGEAPYPGNSIESRRENRNRNKSVEEYLRLRNFGPVKIKGHFGTKEDSFLIPNITRDELLKIGRWFDQQSVIWGEKGIDQNSNPFFLFQYIDCDSGHTQSVRSVHIGSADIQGRNDYYTMVGRRKFIIPFFDDPHSGKVPGNKYGTVADAPSFASQMRKAESFVIPFFDDPSAELIFDENVGEMTYYSGRLPATPFVKTLVETIQTHTNSIFSASLSSKSFWHHRGIVRENLKQIASL